MLKSSIEYVSQANDRLEPTIVLACRSRLGVGWGFDRNVTPDPVSTTTITITYIMNNIHNHTIK